MQVDLYNGCKMVCVVVVVMNVFLQAEFPPYVTVCVLKVQRC